MDIHPRPAIDPVRALLRQADLPWSDLDPDLEHFFGCGTPESPDGVVGLELHPPHALLRSLVVTPDARGKGCGKALVEAAERYARGRGMTGVYLLTETAEPFFRSLGYMAADRATAPAEIQRSREFSELCPDSAVFMHKPLA